MVVFGHFARCSRCQRLLTALEIGEESDGKRKVSDEIVGSMCHGRAKLLEGRTARWTRIISVLTFVEDKAIRYQC